MIYTLKMRKLAWGLLLAAFALCFIGAAGEAQAAEKTAAARDSIQINRFQLETKKIDLANIDMKATPQTKFVLIEKGALEYAAQQGMTIGVVTNYVRVSVPAAAITGCAEWTSAGYSSAGFNFIIELDDVYGLDFSRALPTGEQNRLNVKPVSQEGVGLNMYFRGSNNAYTYIDQLNQDIRFEYYYQTNFRGANRPLPEQTLAFVWVDAERRLQSNKTLNALLPSHVNTTDKVLTVLSPYAGGAYVFVSQTGADNRNTVLAEGGQSAEANSGTVNTGGVPAWAADSVAVLQAAGTLPSDLGGKSFGAPISRGEFAAYLVRTLRLSTSGAQANPFADVKESSPYYKEILAASASGLVAGKTADSFAPEAVITRQEMAVLFNRALAQAKVDFSAEDSKLAVMSDAAQVADWARGGAAACLNSGLIAGKEGNRFAPLETTSWTEAVVMLARLYNIVK